MIFKTRDKEEKSQPSEDFNPLSCSGSFSKRIACYLFFIPGSDWHRIRAKTNFQC